MPPSIQPPKTRSIIRAKVSENNLITMLAIKAEAQKTESLLQEKLINRTVVFFVFEVVDEDVNTAGNGRGLFFDGAK